MIKFGLKVFGIVVLVSFLVGLLVMVARVLLFPTHVGLKGTEAMYKMTDKTLDADNIIYNYEWFKRQYNDYISLKNKVDLSKQEVVNYETSLPADREKWTSQDKDELARLRTILLGQKQQLMDLISEYNAKSQMVNRKIFKTGDLPSQLPNYVE